ncbi:hypothetical protein Tco_1211025 [Tanacetum coccineum]
MRHDLGEFPSEDPYEEAAQSFGAGTTFSRYIPDPIERGSLPVYIPKPSKPEDLSASGDEAPSPLLPNHTFYHHYSDLLLIIPEAEHIRLKRLLLTTPRPSCEVGESSAAAAARQPGPTMAHRVEYSLVDVRSRESSEFYSRHHDAQKDRTAMRAEIEAADDFAVRHIMRTQALEAGARIDTLEHTGSSS